MKEQKNVFLKVDQIEPVYKNGGICCYKETSYLDGIKVWIGNDGHFFSCDKFSFCDPDAVREEGHRQVVALMNELGIMTLADNRELFGYCTAHDILNHFSYGEIVEKLDTWKKENEKVTIRVRDEVYSYPYKMQFVVTKIFVPSGNEDATVNGLKKDGTTVKGILLRNLVKTGVHVDNIDAYLEV